MADKMIHLSDFNSSSVAGYFEVPEDQTCVLAAMKYMHKIMADEMPARPANRLARNQDIALDVIQKIEFRYNLYRLHVPYFFQKSCKPDLDALVIAVICDEYTNHANSTPIESGDPDAPECFRNDGFDDAILLKSCDIFEEACTMNNRIPADDEEPACQEALLLSAINLFGDLKDLNESFGDYTDTELAKSQRDLFPPALNLVDNFIGHTLIGQDLKLELEKTHKRILSRLAPPEILPPARKPHLQLVPPTN